MLSEHCSMHVTTVIDVNSNLAQAAAGGGSVCSHSGINTAIICPCKTVLA